MPMPRRTTAVTRHCAFCGDEFVQHIRPCDEGRKTCGPKCRGKLHTHSRFGASVERKRALVLKAAKKTARFDGTVYYSEIAKELGWPKHRVGHHARELKRQRRWHYKITGTAPRIDSFINCDWCDKRFRDPNPWKPRPHRYCTSKCANTALWAARRIRQEKSRHTA